MSAVERTYNVTEFKAKCLEVFDQLSKGVLTRVTVTRRGKPVGTVTPPDPVQADVSSLYGCMAGSVVIPEGFDLTAPVLDEPSDAERGILHR